MSPPPGTHGAVVHVEVVRLQGDEPAGAPVSDRVAVEAPLLLRLRRQAGARGSPGAEEATILMRTPGHDEELVRGFLLSEGLLGDESELVSIRRPEGLLGDELGNVVIAELATSGRGALERFSVGSSSCGACGKTSIGALSVDGDVSAARLTVSRSVLLSLPARMREAQAAFDETGGVHASALFASDGTLALVREDVGRHNALDKIVGWAVERRLLPLHAHALLVSGRVSYDLVQKAILAGIPLLAAVGAPSSFAVTLAEQAGMTLVGFLRNGNMTVYTHPGRVVEARPSLTFDENARA